MEREYITAGGAVPKERPRARSPPVENQSSDFETISKENEQLKATLERMTYMLERMVLELKEVKVAVKGVKAEVKDSKAEMRELKTEMKRRTAAFCDSQTQVTDQSQELGNSSYQAGEKIPWRNPAVDDENDHERKAIPGSSSIDMKENKIKETSTGNNVNLSQAIATDSEELTRRQDVMNYEQDTNNVNCEEVMVIQQEVEAKLTNSAKEKKRETEARKKEDMELVLSVMKALKRDDRYIFEGSPGKHQTS
ncbi:uncharacterized protein LOC122266601 [Penaeus japonicus]|uniref:uncharacterized protein LOC122266601 n=1 Tax=Penaeus japonicus TaxID=27405 RepID=UPI001C715115|nr:uncharacterized protein LOC122266601 [Penaeus japonicus]